MAAEAVPCAWWIGRDRLGVGGGKKVCAVLPGTAAPSFVYAKCLFEFLYNSFSDSSIYIVQLCKGYSDMTKRAKSARDYLLNIQAERKEIEVLKAVPSARGWTMEHMKEKKSSSPMSFRERRRSEVSVPFCQAVIHWNQKELYPLTFWTLWQGRLHLSGWRGSFSCRMFARSVHSFSSQRT